MGLNATIRYTTLDQILSNESGVTYADLEKGFHETGGWLPVQKTELMFLDNSISEILQQFAEEVFGCSGYITLFWSSEIQRRIQEEISDVPEWTSRLNTILRNLEPGDFLFIDFA